MKSLNHSYSHFEGHQECGISLEQLYAPLSGTPTDGFAATPKICKNRAVLLEAMSGGCHYRWYTTEEICMILDRFDGVVFVGDDMLHHIYAAFNILLREDLALGGLEHWRMSGDELKVCRCDNQFTRAACKGFMVGSSEGVQKHNTDGGRGSPYACNRTPHFFVPITTSPAPTTAHAALTSLLSTHPTSYKPIPILHGLGPSISWSTAASSMDEWIALADASRRNTPMLWIGPTAAGHLLPPDRIMSQGNNALWHYAMQMGKEARQRGVEVLGMWNLTVQASSWDGVDYGEGVGVVQAMMIINWLSRVEST
ncbi:hypothetical protein W97_07005 [Coniosporium apollinis CBS 100218]|uniref:Uncharacterized protein n=1 Tax=Coniosporium apollinis (strain CBS 100218) TaxID=1168221 RepID=R7Z1G2_CONA1|nr:uncharacterized protein W97_07005 [Coniosporium apollinis CBS 100218]EON67751.1 hypothetical protein W97_07005 [Coniosporium apollinis CBS 100218]